MNELFDLCVVVLSWLGELTGLGYKGVNVVIFCIIWPAVTIWLVLAVWWRGRVIKDYQEQLRTSITVRPEEVKINKGDVAVLKSTDRFDIRILNNSVNPKVLIHSRRMDLGRKVLDMALNYIIFRTWEDPHDLAQVTECELLVVKPRIQNEEANQLMITKTRESIYRT